MDEHMKIIIPTIGSRGDVQPYIALHQTQSPEMRQRAADLGAAIRAEPDGVAEAVRLIEQSDWRRQDVHS